MAGAHSRGIVYIRKDLNVLTNTYDRATLVHELVHYLQYKNKKIYKCTNDKERQAYFITTMWLRQAGITPSDYRVMRANEKCIRKTSS